MTERQVGGYLVLKSDFIKSCTDFLRNSLYNNAIYLMLNTIVTSLLGFLFWYIMAHFFTPEQVGIGSSLMSATNLVTTICNLGLGSVLIRFLSEARDSANELINSSLTIVGTFSISCSMVYIIGINFWSPALNFIGQEICFILVFVLATTATGLSSLIDQVLVAGRASRYVFLKNTCVCILKLPLPVLVLGNLNGFGIYTSIGLSTLAGVLLALYYFLPSLYPSYRTLPMIRINLLQPLLRYATGNYLAFLFGNIYGFFLPLMVLNYFGPEQSAYFYISWMMNGVISVVATGTAGSLFAEGSNDPRLLSLYVRRSLSMTILLLVPVVLAGMILAPWLLNFFGHDYSLHGTALVRWLALGNIPAAINLFYITVNQVHKKINHIVFQSGLSSVLTVGISNALIGYYGLAGIGIAYTLSQFFIFLFVWPYLWRIIKVYQQK